MTCRSFSSLEQQIPHCPMAIKDCDTRDPDPSKTRRSMAFHPRSSAKSAVNSRQRTADDTDCTDESGRENSSIRVHPRNSRSIVGREPRMARISRMNAGAKFCSPRSSAKSAVNSRQRTADGADFTDESTHEKSFHPWRPLGFFGKLGTARRRRSTLPPPIDDEDGRTARFFRKGRPRSFRCPGKDDRTRPVRG